MAQYQRVILARSIEIFISGEIIRQYKKPWLHFDPAREINRAPHEKYPS
jgi:hypothetical protein